MDGFLGIQFFLAFLATGLPAEIATHQGSDLRKGLIHLNDTENYTRTLELNLRSTLGG